MPTSVADPQTSMTNTTLLVGLDLTGPALVDVITEFLRKILRVKTRFCEDAVVCHLTVFVTSQNQSTRDFNHFPLPLHPSKKKITHEQWDERAMISTPSTMGSTGCLWGRNICSADRMKEASPGGAAYAGTLRDEEEQADGLWL